MVVNALVPYRRDIYLFTFLLCSCSSSEAVLTCTEPFDFCDIMISLLWPLEIFPELLSAAQHPESTCTTRACLRHIIISSIPSLIFNS